MFVPRKDKKKKGKTNIGKGRGEKERKDKGGEVREGKGGGRGKSKGGGEGKVKEGGGEGTGCHLQENWECVFWKLSHRFQIFLLLHLFMCVYIHTHVCSSLCAEVRGQHAGVGAKELNSGN